MDLSKIAVSINKAINTQEVAVKEKHARTCILGTHHEKGAHTFWAAVNRLPLSSNAVLCWKFCHVFHKLLRDGHPNVIKDSMRNKADLADMSRMWAAGGYRKWGCCDQDSGVMFPVVSLSHTPRQIVEDAELFPPRQTGYNRSYVDIVYIADV
uniref:Huntingtin interacting protein 1 n=1 Tax=Xiphophorus maculatus TaxID=8083 RepID=A0A3B5Q5A1_XIPMA